MVAAFAEEENEIASCECELAQEKKSDSDYQNFGFSLIYNARKILIVDQNEAETRFMNLKWNFISSEG